MSKITQLTAYSYSRWNDYNQCPARAKYKYIDKIKTPDDESPALVRGSRLHKLGENFLKGNIAVVPAELDNFRQDFHDIRDANAASEETWAFNKEWIQRGNFDRDVFCRIKTDVHLLIPDKKLLRIIDLKSGKIKESGYDEQLELYALGGFAKYGSAVEIIQVELWWLDHPKSLLPSNPTRNKFAAWQRDSIFANWERRTKGLLSDTQFLPTPGNVCRWCPYSASKNGPCEF